MERLQLSAKIRDAKDALQRRNSQLREAREDLRRARGDLADCEARLTEARRLLKAVEDDRAELAAGATLNKFWIRKKKLEEENPQLKEQLSRVENATIRLMFDHEAELKAEREQRQRLEAQLAVLQIAQQKPKTKSWWRRLGW